MRYMLLRRSLMLMVGVSLLLMGCGTDGGTADVPEGATEDGGAEGGDELVIATGYPHTTLDSAWAYSSISGVVVRNIQEPLIDRSPEAPDEYVPILATEWERVDDSTLRLQLREGVQYHDGSAFNAEAAADALNFLLDPANELLILEFMGPQITANAVEEHVLELRTEEPDPILESRLPFFVLPSPQQVEEGGREAWETEPVGTGPYRFVEWQRGQQIKLEANDDWWGGELDIQDVTFLERPDGQTRVTAIEAGEAHLTDQLPADACHEALGDNCVSNPSDIVVYLRPDATSDPALGDRRVREAMALAIDKETIAEELWAGAAQPAPMMIPPGSVGFDESLEPYPYDPERARELIEEAAADGVPVEGELILGIDRGRTPGAEQMGEIVHAALLDVGLNVELLIQDQAALYEWFLGNAPPGRNRMVIFQHQNRAYDYSVTLEAWILCEGANSTYCNEEVDELAAEAETLAGEDRHEAYKEIARIIHEDVGITPLWYLDNNYGVAASLEWSPRADQMLYVKEMSLR